MRQGKLEQVVGGEFFDRVPGADEVVFERSRTSPHAERIKRIMKALPEGFVCTLIDGNTPATLGQQGHMEGLGWSVVPRSEIKNLGIEEWVPNTLILMVCRQEVRDRHEAATVARAHKSVRDAAQFEADGMPTTTKVVEQAPVAVTGPVRAGS